MLSSMKRLLKQSLYLSSLLTLTLLVFFGNIGTKLGKVDTSNQRDRKDSDTNLFSAFQTQPVYADFATEGDGEGGCSGDSSAADASDGSDGSSCCCD
jgi:hypothetical protein